MKKLFTLVALLACFLGAKAEWVEDYKIDYSTQTGFPFYVMGYVPEWVDGVMTDYGAMYKYVEVKDDATETSDVIVKTANGVEYYKISLTEGAWHQYFIADGIPTELDGAYTVKAMVKASEAVTVNVNMGWGWGDGQQAHSSLNIGTEWAEVEFEFTGIGGTSCNLVAQPGGSTATIEWKYVIVGHNAKPQRPTTWQQWLTNDGKSIIPDVATESKYMGDAEFGAWPDWSLELTDGVNINWRGDRTGEICAWGLTMGKNNDSGEYNGTALDGRARPFPADIEVDPTDKNGKNHVFAVHVDKIEKIDDDSSIQWSNQFWIQSPQGWKSGTQVRIKFRYRAEKAAKTGTQIHKQHPSDYLHWEAVGDVNFTTEWQDFEKIVTFNDSQSTGWSLAFNLCAGSTVDAPQEPNVFYFDDLSWETMKLDEGLFVAASNTAAGIEYDFDNAIEFTQAEDLMVATVGTKGKKETWVNEIMISTIRGNDAAFKGATIKPTGTIVNDPDTWLDYTEASLAKLKLPAAGVWTISIDTEGKQINFVKVEGEEDKEPIAIITNPTVVTVKGQERDWRGKDNDGNPIEAGGVGEGQPWDNQFWIVANRTLSSGEATVIKFKYKASKEAKTSTQCHAAPGAYLHWGAIGDVNFTTEWQEFEKEFTVPNEANDMQSIAFNMAEIKEACDYEIKDVQWYLKEDANAEGKTSENLIGTGEENFYVKEGAGTDPYQFSGINGVMVQKSSSSAIYNLAGQRVSKTYKGIVVKDGKKFLTK